MTRGVKNVGLSVNRKGRPVAARGRLDRRWLVTGSGRRQRSGFLPRRPPRAHTHPISLTCVPSGMSSPVGGPGGRVHHVEVADLTAGVCVLDARQPWWMVK